jgi:hypothetical protein
LTECSVYASIDGVPIRAADAVVVDGGCANESC